jgi:sulfotransferase 6B1
MWRAAVSAHEHERAAIGMAGQERLRAVMRSAAWNVAHTGLAALWWASGTRVLQNSVPKCGTYLLRRTLDLVGLRPSNAVAVNPSADQLLDGLACHRGMAQVAHVPANPGAVAAVRQTGARVLLITRDPRDQAVSHAFHYRTHEEHQLHRYFRDHLQDFDDALMAVIRGFGPGPQSQLPDVDSFFRAFLPWRDLPETYWTTYERLVGPRGGGSSADQKVEVAAILSHLGFPLAATTVAALLAGRVYSEHSPTFRCGQQGQWRQYFKPRHVQAFKEIAGRLLIELGYESSLDW